MGDGGTGNDMIELGSVNLVAFAVDDVDVMKQKLGNRAVVQQMGWGNAIETADPQGNRLNLYRLGPHNPTE